MKNYIARDPAGIMRYGFLYKKTHLVQILDFVRKALEDSHSSNEEHAGVATLGILVAIFENMFGVIGAHLPELLNILFQELNHQHYYLDSATVPFMSMLLQAISMAFACCPGLAFQWLTDNDSILKVFQLWFSHMGHFQKELELRRMIFGLTAIIKTASSDFPMILQLQLPEIMSQLATFTLRLHRQRENEDYVYNEPNDDNSVYKSHLDSVDPIAILQDALIAVEKDRPQFYRKMMAGVSRELQAELIKAFSEVHSIERYRQSQLEGLEEPLVE